MLHQDRHGNTAYTMEPDDEEQVLPIALDLKKTRHFFRFLRRELVQARTEVEKEVVRSELARVGGRLLALKMKLSEFGEHPLEHEEAHGRAFHGLSVSHLQ